MFKEEHTQVMESIDFTNLQKPAHNLHVLLTGSIIDDMQ